jgi:Cu/Ag efflux protein CusF
MSTPTLRQAPDPRTLRAGASTAAGFLSLVLPLVAACAGAPEEHDGGATASRVTTYTVRGRVVALPSTGGGEIRLAHEAIGGFESAAGEVVGMEAMTMSFPVAASVDDAALAPGDVVEFELRVDWSAEQPATVTRIEPLPAGTELALAAEEPASGPG